MDKQRGRPVLVEFFDVTLPSSLRTLPYIKEWHARYADEGLRVISIHSPGSELGRDEDAVRAAVERLGVEHAVCLDTDLEVWGLYATRGWPSRYLFDQQQKLFEYHHGEGGYHETERAIQELLGIERDLVPHLRPEDDPEALLVVPTEDVEGPYSGPYEAGEVWVVVSGEGVLGVDGTEVPVAGPQALRVARHSRHTSAVLELRPGDGVTVHRTTFAAGLAPEDAVPAEQV